MAYKDDVKPWFETGDFPTQAQFYAWFEKIRWADEPIAFEDLTLVLQNIINALASPVEEHIIDADHLAGISCTVPAGFLLEKIIFQPVADRAEVLSLKNFDAEEEDWWIIENDSATAAAGKVWAVDLLGTPGGEMPLVFFGGGLGDKVTFIKRKISI